MEGSQLLFSGLTVTFLRNFFVGLWLTFPMLLTLAGGIVLLGRVAGRIEKWSWLDCIYWSFITATTVGYGDIRPTKRISRVIAIVIAFMGLTMTGIVIAVAVNAAAAALSMQDATSLKP
jgi:voltage-gated potassium channel